MRPTIATGLRQRKNPSLDSWRGTDGLFLRLLSLSQSFLICCDPICFSRREEAIKNLLQLLFLAVKGHFEGALKSQEFLLIGTHRFSLL